jgi:3-oxoacyl-ACP reductase-like protein
MAGYLGVDPNSKKPTRPTRNEMEKVERAKSADTKPALVVKVPTPEETAKAASLIPTVADISTKAELKTLYNENASILEVRVDGVTLLDAINKRLVQL